MSTKDKTEYFFKSKISNMINLSRDKNYIKFSYFLDDNQLCIADSVLKESRCENYCFYGGYENSQRVILCVYPDYITKNDIQWPFKVLLFEFNKKYKLSHKDFLGALMSLQIKRELLGDINVSDGKAEIVAHDNCCNFIVNNISKVGRVGVKVSVTENITLNIVPKFKDIFGTIASYRIDNIVALCTALSRTKSVEIIKASRVTVNYKEIFDNSYIVKPNDIIRIRGYGKYVLTDNEKKTKKNRYYVTIQKYI